MKSCVTVAHLKHVKLLMIHADDFGMCHSINEAIFTAFEQQAISSASVMAPCPCFLECVQYVKTRPECDVGVHLTLTSEWNDYKWGPVHARNLLGLTDKFGNFWPTVHQIHADQATIQGECLAQVALAVKAGIHVSHLDSHMLFPLHSTQLLLAYTLTAQRVNVPFVRYPGMPDHNSGDGNRRIPIHIFQADPSVPSDCWEQYYLSVLDKLPVGVSQLVVHPGFDSLELRAITAGHVGWGATWRQRDFDVLVGDRFKSALERLKIQVVDWAALRRLIS
jgi:chitin disaccharide deacetylase